MTEYLVYQYLMISNWHLQGKHKSCMQITIHRYYQSNINGKNKTLKWQLYSIPHHQVYNCMKLENKAKSTFFKCWQQYYSLLLKHRNEHYQ